VGASRLRVKSDTGDIEGRRAANITKAHNTEMTASTFLRKSTPDSMEQISS